MRLHKRQLTSLVRSLQLLQIGGVVVYSSRSFNPLECEAVAATSEAITLSCHSCWQVERSRGRPLDIDLGAEHIVTDFSTMGRHPLTRRYPETKRNSTTTRSARRPGCKRDMVVVQQRPVC